jgi:hypothetical protein
MGKIVNFVSLKTHCRNENGPSPTVGGMTRFAAPLFHRYELCRFLNLEIICL